MPNHQLDLFQQPQARPDIRIRESKRARHLSIQVSESKGVEVVVPPRTRPHAVRQFVEAHRDWIQHARDELDVTGPPPLLFLPDHIALRINGEAYSVTYGHKRDRAGPAGTVVSAGELHHGPPCTARLAAPQRPGDSDSAACATGAGHGHVVPPGPGARSAHALGQLFVQRHAQHQLLPVIRACRPGRLSLHSRVVPHTSHESLGAILATRQSLCPELQGTGEAPE